MRRPLVLAVYLSIAVLWGSTWMVIRVGLRDLPPFLFAGIRMALAALLLAPLALRGGALDTLRRSWRTVVVIGLFQTALPYGLMFVGQQWVPSGLAAAALASRVDQVGPFFSLRLVRVTPLSPGCDGSFTV